MSMMMMTFDIVVWHSCYLLLMMVFSIGIVWHCCYIIAWWYCYSIVSWYMSIQWLMILSVYSFTFPFLDDYILLIFGIDIVVGIVCVLCLLILTHSMMMIFRYSVLMIFIDIWWYLLLLSIDILMMTHHWFIVIYWRWYHLTDGIYYYYKTLFGIQYCKRGSMCVFGDIRTILLLIFDIDTVVLFSRTLYSVRH